MYSAAEELDRKVSETLVDIIKKTDWWIDDDE